MKLIDKDVLIAELKRLQGVLQDPAMNRESMRDYAYGGNKIINEIRSFINSLEVKEVHLEDSIDTYINGHYSEGCDRGMISDENRDIGGVTYFDLMSIAKHFFELGLKVQKGELYDKEGNNTSATKHRRQSG